MPYCLTFVAAQHYPNFENLCRKAVDEHSIAVLDINILSSDKAVDIIIEQNITTELSKLRTQLECDVFIQSHNPETRRKKLLLSDMDATIVAEETLDELAASLGLKEKISEITAATMRGELNFEDSVRKRVAMLKDLPVSELEKTAATLTYSKGAATLIRTMNAYGAHTVLVSGGFTYFTSHVAKHIGFKENFGNTLGILGHKLNGEVIPPICGKEYKAQLLQQKSDELNIPLHQALSVGDGANDADMLCLAQNHKGLGVGYQPKPLLQEKLSNLIIYGDLTSLLYAQGYKEEEIHHEA